MPATSGEHYKLNGRNGTYPDIKLVCAWAAIRSTITQDTNQLLVGLPPAWYRARAVVDGDLARHADIDAASDDTLEKK